MKEVLWSLYVWQDITESMIRMYFAKNSGPMALAYEFQVAQLGLNSLFPHVSSKNLTVEFNFGQVVSNPTRSTLHISIWPILCVGYFPTCKTKTKD